MRLLIQLIKQSILLILLFSACYSRKEACLDLLASNYDVTADDPCVEKCCVYPSLNIAMALKVEDIPFKTEDTLVNSLGQRFRIIDLRCYFSDFSLFQNNGSKIKNIETITSVDNLLKTHDDIVLWKTDSNFKSGTFKAYGTFDSLIFHIGIDSSLKHTVFGNISSGHPLAENTKLKGKDGSITDMTIRCIRLTDKPDTINLYISLDQPIKITSKNMVTTHPGQEISYNFGADMTALMKNIDLQMSLTSIENQIKNNILTSVFVR